QSPPAPHPRRILSALRRGPALPSLHLLDAQPWRALRPLPGHSSLAGETMNLTKEQRHFIAARYPADHPPDTLRRRTVLALAEAGGDLPLDCLADRLGVNHLALYSLCQNWHDVCYSRPRQRVRLGVGMLEALGLASKPERPTFATLQALLAHCRNVSALGML